MEIKTLIGLLAGFLLLAILLYLYYKHRKPGQAKFSGKQIIDNIESWGEPSTQRCASCMANGNCPSRTHKTQKTKPIEYYNDEELDQYANREANSYSLEEEADFREVFETLLESDLKGWLISLKKRHITLPQSLQATIEQKPEFRHFFID